MTLNLMLHLLIFSKTGKGSRYQNILKKIDLSIVPNDVCQQQLRSTRLGNFFRLHESFICAGGIRGEDTCKVSKTCDFDKF